MKFGPKQFARAMMAVAVSASMCGTLPAAAQRASRIEPARPSIPPAQARPVPGQPVAAPQTGGQSVWQNGRWVQMPPHGRPDTPPRHNPGRWGGHVEGRWWAGMRAPGGWGGYHRPVRGWVLPSYWFVRDFMIPDYLAWGLAAPPYGYFWMRYYDDAVLVDTSGRVWDSVNGISWDGGEQGVADAQETAGTGFEQDAAGAQIAPPPPVAAQPSVPVAVIPAYPGGGYAPPASIPVQPAAPFVPTEAQIAQCGAWCGQGSAAYYGYGYGYGAYYVQPTVTTVVVQQSAPVIVTTTTVVEEVIEERVPAPVRRATRRAAPRPARPAPRPAAQPSCSCQCVCTCVPTRCTR